MFPKVILKKKCRAEGIRLLDYRLDYATTDIKIVWYWNKNRNINQWNRIENPEISPYTYSQLMHDKGSKTTQWWEDSLINK